MTKVKVSESCSLYLSIREEEQMKRGRDSHSSHERERTDEKSREGDEEIKWREEEV